MSPFVKDTCKIGQGHDCCRYLLMGAKGFECAKLSKTGALLDSRVADKSMNARGNNCDGYTESESINFLNNKE